MFDCNPRESEGSGRLVLPGERSSRRGNFDEAIADLNRAIELEPGNPLRLVERNRCYRDKGNLAAALKDANAALRLDAKYASALTARAETYLRLRNWPAARKDFDGTIEVDPNNAANFTLRSRFLTTCPDVQYRDADQAREDASAACELTDWKSSELIEMLAAALAEAGEFEQAAAEQTKVLGDAAYLKTHGTEPYMRLALYEVKRVYRIPATHKKTPDPPQQPEASTGWNGGRGSSKRKTTTRRSRSATRPSNSTRNMPMPIMCGP